MENRASGIFTHWRALLLLAAIPALTNCSRIDGSVELSNSSGEPYSFEGATVEVFSLNRAVVLAGQKIPLGLGSVESGAGNIALQVVTATIDDDALYDVEIRCPAGNATDACNVEAPLHVVLNGLQLKAGGWNATALTEAIFHNIAYYAAAEYAAADITQMANRHAGALLVSDPAAAAQTYDDVLSWNATQTTAIRRPATLNAFSEALANGASDSDLKLAAKRWISPYLGSVKFEEQWEEEPDIVNIIVANDYAYLLGGGFGFSVVDIRNPEQPVTVGQSPDINPYGTVKIAGERAYVKNIDTQAWEVHNLTNPQQITKIGEFSWPGTLLEIAGDNAYFVSAGNSRTLQVVDIGNLQQPQLQGQVAFPEFVAAVLAGEHIYLTTADSLRIIDVSNAAAPAESGNLPLTEPNSLAVDGDHAYLMGTGGLRIIDIGNAANPIQVGQLDFVQSQYRVIKAAQRHVYIVTDANEITVVDASNPAAPALTGTLAVPGYILTALATHGDFAYAASNDNHVSINYDKIFTILDPSLVKPQVVQSGSLALDGGAPGRASSAGNYLYLQNAAEESSPGFLVVDANDPVAPQLLVKAWDYRFFGSVVAQGDYAFLGDHQWGALRVADISNRADPVPVDDASILFDQQHEELWGLAGIVLSGNYVYAPWGNAVDSAGGNGGWGCTNPNEDGGRGGLFAVDISAPTAPFIAGHLCMPEAANAVAVSGTQAYVALDYGLLQGADFSNPATPALGASVQLTSTSANFLTTVGNTVWATENHHGIDIVDVSNPAAIAVATTIDTPGLARHATVDGHYAYVAEDAGGVLIFDIATPAAPTLAASLDTAGRAYSVSIIGDYLYVGTGVGIEVFRTMPASSN